MESPFHFLESRRIPDVLLMPVLIAAFSQGARRLLRQRIAYLVLATNVLAVLAAWPLASALAAVPGETTQGSRRLVDLGPTINTPDGLGLAPDGTLILSVPNFNNDHLMQRGRLAQAQPPFMAAIDARNGVRPWYVFQPGDLHPDTGRIGPMDNAFGPDGNLYVADMQVFASRAHKSRILRINVRQGVASSVDVVAEGMIAANGLAWHGDTLFVTDSILIDPTQEQAGQPLVSGVYAFSLRELQGPAPVRVAPHTRHGKRDRHLVGTFASSARMGFGADGIAFDDAGHLFVSVIEDAAIYKLSLDANHKAKTVKRFAQGKTMRSVDGMVFDPKRQRLYVADFLGNAAHAIDTQGRVSTLQKNGDTTGADGQLDQPAEVAIRGDELIVVNMDLAWATRGLSVNQQVDTENNLAVIALPEPRQAHDMPSGEGSPLVTPRAPLRQSGCGFQARTQRADSTFRKHLQGEYDAGQRRPSPRTSV